jgi:hypothetical protein
MEKGWVKVYFTPDELQMECACNSLKRVEIDSVIINKKDRAYGFGDFELYVHRDNVIRAKQILKDF